MNFNFNFLWPERIIIDRPIEDLSGKGGSFKALPTPEVAECRDFKVFGKADFILNSRRLLPTRSISTIHGGLVHGQSGALFTIDGRRSATHLAALPELKLTADAGNYSNFFEKIGPGWRFRENARLRPTKRFDRGVLIGSRYSFNYFHFVCDSLVRAMIADDNQEFAGWPLIITPSAPQIAEMARLLCPERDIIQMEPSDLVHFNALAVPISSSYSPDDPSRSGEAVIDFPYLPKLRDRLAPAMGRLRKGQKVVFIKRPVYRTEKGELSRNIVNQDEIIAHIEAIGGETASPEKLTVEAQRQLFAGADTVVAMAGSALANLVFCRAGTTVVMVCQNKTVQPAYFGMMCEALGLRLIVVACPPVEGTSPHPSHLSVTVDLEMLKQAIDFGMDTQ